MYQFYSLNRAMSSTRLVGEGNGYGERERECETEKEEQEQSEPECNMGGEICEVKVGGRRVLLLIEFAINKVLKGKFQQEGTRKEILYEETTTKLPVRRYQKEGATKKVPHTNHNEGQRRKMPVRRYQ